ncbi:hypothetical protein BH11PLA1_BH11PLA1_10070 [soil metagenome]
MFFAAPSGTQPTAHASPATIGVRAVTPVDAKAQGIAVAPEPGNAYVQARLTASHAAVTPGQAFQLALRFDTKPRWHLYSPSENDSGMPIQVHVTAPGVVVGPAHFPAPKRHIAPGDILDHIYEGSTTLLWKITVPTSARVGTTLSLGVDTEFLVCDESCLPGKSALKIDIPVMAAARPSADAAMVAAALAAMPALLLTDAQTPATVTISGAGETRQVTIAAKGAAGIAYFPGEGSVKPENLVTSGTTEGEPLRLVVKPSAGKRLAGIIEVRWPVKAAAGEKAGRGAAVEADAPRAPSTFRIDLPLDNSMAEKGPQAAPAVGAKDVLPVDTKHEQIPAGNPPRPSP